MVWWDERCIHGGSYERLAAESQSELCAIVDLDCEYTRQFVTRGFARRPEWSVEFKSPSSDGGQSVDSCVAYNDDSLLFLWAEYERIDWSAVDEGSLCASSYFIRKGLIRKGHLAHNMKKWAAKRPNGWIDKCTPETYILDVDDPMYLEEALCDVPEVRDMEEGSEIWIAKPSITNQGHSVCVFDRVSSLAEAVNAAEDLREWVVQRYIHPPLLLDGRKFHLRVYALCIGSLKVYVYSDVLVLFAGSPYDSELQNLSDLSSHLTNTCQQEGTEEHSEENEQKIIKLLSELPEELVKSGMSRLAAESKVSNLSQEINAIVGECFEAVSGELTFFTLPNCFELFGFDLMVDADWHCWLLEANAEPDFKQTGERLQYVIEGLIEGVLAHVLDPIARKKGFVSDMEGHPLQGTGQWVQVFESQVRRPF